MMQNAIKFWFVLIFSIMLALPISAESVDIFVSKASNNNWSGTLFRFVLIFSIMLALPISAESVNIFVSKAGNDNWSGTLAEPNPGKTDGPLLTITAAQKQVRSLLKNEKKSIKVILREGTYRLEKPLVFTPQDSGTQRDPVIWTSYKDEKVIISAGKLIKNWEKVDEDIPGLPQKAAGKIWYADLPEGTKFYSLFNDKGILPQAASGKLHTTEDIKKSSISKLNWEGNDLDNHVTILWNTTKYITLPTEIKWQI